MNEMGMLVLVVGAMACLLALPVSVLVRISVLPFSARARGQVKRHPLLHFLWLLAAVAVFFVVFVLTGSDRPKGKGSSNKASDATSEPAPGVASSPPQG